MCECTCQTALPGPNQPGSPTGAANSMPRKKCLPDVLVEALLEHLLDDLVRQVHGDSLGSGHDCNQNTFGTAVTRSLTLG